VRPTSVTNTIRALRTERDLTQAQLAELLGVTRQTVIAVEQGRYSPSLELAFQIARALGRPIDQVFFYETDGGQR
jgi:putative transcriptional regulator